MNRSQKIFAIAWLVLAAVTLWATGSPGFSALDPLSFPRDLSDWDHTMSGVSGNTYHEIYLNPVAGKTSNGMPAYRNGSRILVVFKDDRGSVLNYGLMAKEGDLFPKTDGWGFASFDANRTSQPVNVERDCWACHSAQSKTDHVFTGFLQ